MRLLPMMFLNTRAQFRAGGVFQKGTLARRAGCFHNWSMLNRCFLLWFLAAAVCSVAATTHSTADSSAAWQTFLAQQPYSPAVIARIERQLTATEPLAVMLTLATDPTNETRMIAAQLLGESGASAAVPPLWRLLRDDSEPVRMMAAAALPRLHARTPVLLDATGLKDECANVRRLVAETLAKIGDKTVEPALLATLADGDEIVRWQVVLALARCGTAQAVPGLMTRLHDDSVRVRKTAAAVLGQLGDQTTVAPLGALLADNDWHVRAAAARALNHLAERLGAAAATSGEAVLAKLRTDDYAVVWAAWAMTNARSTRSYMRCWPTTGNWPITLPRRSSGSRSHRCCRC